MELTRRHLERLAMLIAQRSGMAFPEERWPFLRCRVQSAMARARRAGRATWMELLGGGPEVPDRSYVELEEALRVAETSFFRYKHHHRALRELVIPAALRGGPVARRSPLRIWSVGCSTGEEPYSIAMTVHERFPYPPAGRVEILAMDANRNVLTVAERATYTAASVAAVPPAYRATYFRKRGGTFTVVPSVRALVSFFHQDIQKGFYAGKFDAAFCCNVLLYCTVDAKRRIVERLAASLHRGGFLFVGHADGITPPAEWFAPAPLPVGFVYQRV